MFALIDLLIIVTLHTRFEVLSFAIPNLMNVGWLQPFQRYHWDLQLKIGHVTMTMPFQGYFIICRLAVSCYN